MDWLHYINEVSRLVHTINAKQNYNNWKHKN